MKAGSRAACCSFAAGSPPCQVDLAVDFANNTATRRRRREHCRSYRKPTRYAIWLCLYVPLEIFHRDLNTCRPIAYCQPVSGISGRRHLRSADRGHLDFPRVKLASYGGHWFAYAGPSNWNSLPAHLRHNSLSLSSFRRHLKTFLFSFY